MELALWLMLVLVGTAAGADAVSRTTDGHDQEPSEVDPVDQSVNDHVRRGPYRVEDVKNEKARVDREVRGLLADAKACGALTDAERAHFVQKGNAWQRVLCGADEKCAEPRADFLYTIEQLDAVHDFERTLKVDRAELTGNACTVSRLPEAPEGLGSAS